MSAESTPPPAARAGSATPSRPIDDDRCAHVAATDLRLATVTVTYNPDLDVLRRQLRELPSQFLRIVVDNASTMDLRTGIEDLARDVGALFICNESNKGLPSALNQGIWTAQRAGCTSALLLDQDTEPERGAVMVLIDAHDRLRDAGKINCCLGPRLIDVTTGLEHGFHQIIGKRWSRAHPSAAATDPVVCSTLNGSGTLIPMSVAQALGGLDESLFIDHVDTEWSFRVKAAGYELLGIPAARFAHRMGDESRRIWIMGWRVWPVRTPQRHYYLFRNAMALMRRDYVPLVWKLWVVPKLAATMLVFVTTGPARASQLTSMMKGLFAGLTGRDGSA